MFRLVFVIALVLSVAFGFVDTVNAQQCNVNNNQQQAVSQAQAVQNANVEAQLRRLTQQLSQLSAPQQQQFVQVPNGVSTSASASVSTAVPQQQFVQVPVQRQIVVSQPVVQVPQVATVVSSPVVVPVAAPANSLSATVSTAAGSVATSSVNSVQATPVCSNGSCNQRRGIVNALFGSRQSTRTVVRNR